MFRFSIATGGNDTLIKAVIAAGYEMDESQRETLMKDLALKKNYLSEDLLAEDPEYAELEDVRFFVSTKKADSLKDILDKIKKTIDIEPEKIWLGDQIFEKEAILELWQQ